MRIAACQLPHIENDVDQALSLVEKYTSDAERQSASLICFPECFLQGYAVTTEHVNETAIELESPQFKAVLRRLVKFKPTIVLGVIERDDGRIYNAAVAIERGAVVTRYRKTHLLDGEKSIFKAGSHCPVFDVCGIKVGINICFDLNHAQSVQTAARAGARLLACPCNNMMRRSAAEQWKLRHNEIRSERAREANLWLMSSDITGEANERISYGPTAVIDPLGQVVDQVPLMKTGMIVVEIR